MINQLSKFTTNLAEKAKPLHDLLSKKNQWTWERVRQAFEEIKQQLKLQTSIGPVQLMEGDMCLSRCIVLWLGGCADIEAIRWFIEASFLCFSGPHKHRSEVCPDRTSLIFHI